MVVIVVVVVASVVRRVLQNLQHTTFNLLVLSHWLPSSDRIFMNPSYEIWE